MCSKLNFNRSKILTSLVLKGSMLIAVSFKISYYFKIVGLIINLFLKLAKLVVFVKIYWY